MVYGNGISGAGLSPVDLSCRTQDRVPLNREEARKVKKRRKQSQALGPKDEPGYVKKVEKEKKALHKQHNTTNKKEGPPVK